MVAAATGLEGNETLRHGLRRATASLHDFLDRTLGAKALDGPAGYAAFLSRQFAARSAVEEWIGANLAPEGAPPPVAQLIARDLAALGKDLPSAALFRFPENAHPLGLCWAIGGSALGNRAMLARIRNAGISSETRFLSDRSLAGYFARLVPQLEQAACPATIAAAARGAEAVFETFLRASGGPAFLEKAAA